MEILNICIIFLSDLSDFLIVENLIMNVSNVGSCNSNVTCAACISDGKDHDNKFSLSLRPVHTKRKRKRKFCLMFVLIVLRSFLIVLYLFRCVSLIFVWCEETLTFAICALNTEVTDLVTGYAC